MHTSDTSSRSGAGPSIGGKGAVGIMIAAVVVFLLIILFFGFSWYAWGFLGLIIAFVGVYSAARFGVRRATRFDERHSS
jgi:uncharacterized membrane protein